ncbi:hypothetical protein BC943DRAFT_186115 [Umbelopsis sp. AD052]|nr:hypothetical protein BC943DRAFT_186115 [Umbelopsis sp. AD052]
MASSAPASMHSASDSNLNKYASTTAPAPDTPNPDRIADRLVLADLDGDQGDSWDNDDNDNLIGLEDDAWEPLDTTPAQAPEPVTSFVPKRSMATSAAKTMVPPKADRAFNPGTMKLGHKTKFDVDDWGFDDDNETKSANTTHSSAGHMHTSTNRSISPATPATVASNSSSVLSKEDRKAELDRRREERRQRMAELRDKKKTGGIGAKKV